MMVAGSRRWGAALVVAGLVAALLASATTVGAAPDARAPAPLSPEAAEAACPGDLVAIPPAVDGAPPMCTHGPDPAVTPEMLSAEAGITPEAATGIQCYGDGSGGNRVQLLYAYSSSNRINTFRPWIEDRAAAIDAIYDASARQTGGRRFVRWLTNAACDLTITAVQVPSAALAMVNFAGTAVNLIDELKSRGYTRQDRKYLVWVDTGTRTTITDGRCSGVGTLYIDSKPTPGSGTNANFNDRFGGYTRVDDTCLFPVFDSVRGKVEAHELMHTLGAVQPTAPHATIYGHCRDDYDIMCYVDGPGSSLISPRPCPSSSEELLLDCRNDDYFSTAPPAGSYLARNWNSADSSWLETAPGASQPPAPPGPVTGVPGSSSVALTWGAPQSDGGSPILGYRVYRNDTLVVPTASSPTGDPNAAATVTTRAPSFTDTGLADGRTYRYQVAAVNAEGESPRTAAVSVIAGVPRPDAQVGIAPQGPFQFDGVYSSSMAGNTQVLERPVTRGGSVTFFVRIENDRPGTDSLKLKGVASGAAGYAVRYFRGMTDITSLVVAGSYTVADVPPGGHVDIKVKVTASTSTARNSVRSVTITAKSKAVKSVKDVVQVRARRA